MGKLYVSPTASQPSADPPDGEYLATPEPRRRHVAPNEPLPDEFISACITHFLDELDPRMNLRLGRYVPATPAVESLRLALRVLVQLQRQLEGAQPLSKPPGEV